AGLVGAIRADRSLPPVIILRACPGDGPVFEALALLESEGVIRLTEFMSWQRATLKRETAPDAERYLAASLSSSMRKRLRSKRRSLEEMGALRFTVHSDPATLQEAFRSFMAVEASGWKGENGTALLTRPQDARYVEAVLRALAQHDRAFVATLDAGARTMAAGLFLRDGGEVFFWKTAYDGALAKLSPGVIFDQFVTEHLFAQDWFRLLDTATDDSVDPATLIWRERRKMVSLVVDCAPGGWRGPAVVAALTLRQRLKGWKNRRAAAQAK
ncbi:MAG: GNAT family N-acetyltransferase, partial [Beijerinckiaceae bacterium]